MNAVIIAEKPQQARDIKAALGQAYGDVYPAQGHLLRLAEPNEIDDKGDLRPPQELKAIADGSLRLPWTDALLTTPKGRYPFLPDRGDGKGARLDAIKAALKHASTVVIACDCDREGQMIGQELLEYFGYKGAIKRAMFTAQDATSLKKAFASLADNSKYVPMYHAALVRANADQIFNLTMTRVATRNLRSRQAAGEPVIGIGRVKTPTLAILCLRQLEIENFKPDDYFIVHMTVKGAAGSAVLTHAPQKEDRIGDRKRAEAVEAAARIFKGPISVETTRKRRSPPRPVDLPALQKICSRRFRWTSERTLATAQQLYEELKVITYPRGESRYLPESMIPDAGPLLGMLKNIPDYAKYRLAAPVIRKGKSGVWCDAALEGISHHAIIPNINAPRPFADAVKAMNADQAKLFDVVARSFLAAIGEDMVYDSTEIAALVPTPASTPCKFAAVGQVTLDPGFTAIDGGDDDKDAKLPPLKNGETVAATGAEIEAKQTEPPPYFTEGDLIEQMSQAWKYVADPAEKERLKEAKGIGTPATRDTIIKGLKLQNLITPDASGKYIVPTAAGMTLYKTLLKCAPVLVDPGATARMEDRLDEVAKNKVAYQTVIDEIAAIAGNLIPAIQKAGATIDNSKQQRPKLGAAGLPAKPKFGQFKPPGKAAPARPTRAASASSPSRGAAPPRAPAAAPAKGTPIKADFSTKDKAKALGARWDPDAHTWYAPPGVNLEPFRREGLL